MKLSLAHLALVCIAWLTSSPAAEHTLRLTQADYIDRANAIWHGQLIAVSLTLPFEHRVAAVEPVRTYPRPYTTGWIDDDWYYEIAALRGFEKYGIDMTANELGQQWLDNNCGSYGSSAIARANLLKGIPGSESGHPKYNRIWWTIGPVFSADLYGAVAPGMPNEAGRMAREFGRVNGHAESIDGAVIFAGAISLGFRETDPRIILRQAIQLVDPSSPYRRCIETVIRRAEAGDAFDAIVAGIEDEWRIEYPASNNAVANGGITAAVLWFAEGDFWKTIDLAAHAADFSDTDNSAATAISVLAAIKGMALLPAELVAAFGDRIVGNEMNRVPLTPPVDERISDLARRTAAIGEAVILANGGGKSGNDLLITPQIPVTQPAERFALADLMQHWNQDWRLERAGFGGDGVGAMPGLRGSTHLDGNVLATYPRDESRGVTLRRTIQPRPGMKLSFEIAADEGKAWELLVYAGNHLIHRELVEGKDGEMRFARRQFDVPFQGGEAVTLRLYQRTLLNRAGKVPGNAYWRDLAVE